MTEMRLQKFLSLAGIASRRKSEALIQTGQIRINGLITTELGTRIDPQKDEIRYQNKIIALPNKPVYYLLNKPTGYTSTCQDPYAKKTILELVPSEPRVFPVGRLDKNSRGLIILTNDGELANIMTHPRYEHEKEYIVIGRTSDTSDQQIISNLKKLKEGIVLEGKVTLPTIITNIKIQPEKHLVSFHISLKEGRNRQIRRMCDMIEIKVVNLQRIRIGKLKINGLKEGQYQTLELKDIV